MYFKINLEKLKKNILLDYQKLTVVFKEIGNISFYFFIKSILSLDKSIKNFSRICLIGD